METSVDSQDQPQLPPAVPSSRALFSGILRGSSLYGIAQVAPLVASVVLSPLTTRCLTQAEFGISEQLTKVAIVMSALLSVNLASTLGYFYFGATDAAGKRSAAGTAILGSALLGSAGALLCWFLAPFINQWVLPHVDAVAYLRLIAVTLPVSFALDGLLAWLRVENRTGNYVLGAILRVAVTIAGTFLFVLALRMHIWGVLLAAGAAMLLTQIYASAVWLRNMKPAMDTSLYLSMIRFSVPLTGSFLAMFFLHFGDSFILPHYMQQLTKEQRLAEMAIYFLAYKFGMLLSTAYGAFAGYWNAQAFSIMRRDDSQDVFRRISTYMFLVISLIGLGLIVASPPAIHIMYQRDYWRSADLVPVIVLAYFCRSIGDFVRCLFLVEGHPKYDAICTFIGAGICLVGYLGLIPRYGIWGAAIATAIAFAGLCAVSLVWTYRVRRYSIDTPRLLKISAALAAGLALHWLLPSSSLLLEIASAAASMTAFLALLCILQFPTAGEWQLARSTAGRLRLKFAPAR